jgi:rubrerythrin
MNGGIDAWNGLVSRAEIDQGTYLIEGNESPEEIIALAYGLESATYRFYRDLARRAGDGDIRNSLETLAQDEARHQDSLWERYKTVSERPETRESFETGIVIQVLEHGKTADEILAEYPNWTKRPMEAFELAMSLEVDSLDLYLRLAQKSRQEGTAAVFHELAKEEKRHLRRIGELFREELRRESS